MTSSFIPSRQVLDYAQYYLNLDVSNERSSAQWNLEYNFTKHYR